METNSTTSSTARQTSSRAFRAITAGLCAAAFVAVMAFGAPDEHSSRWDADLDAHSEVGFETALGD